MFFRNQIRVFNQQIRNNSTIIRFTNSHEYIKKNDGFYTLGITKFLSRKVNPIIYSELYAKQGSVIKKNQPLLLLESAATTKTITSPFNCIIKRVNYEIVNDPYIINADPLESGWLFEIYIQKHLLYTNDSILTEDEYNDFVEKQ
jgi:glycine cleavage system H protein